MSVVNQAQSKRLVAVHGWSGTILGLLLYVVVLTGAVAVFASEIGEWSAGGRPSASALERPVDARLKELASEVDPAYLDEVVAFSNSGGELVVFFHTHEVRADGTPGDVGVRFYLDPETLEVVRRYEGFSSEMPADPAGALDDFIVDLHVNLYAPHPWGLYATGILGFVMLIAAISGILLHKHVIKDLFVAPRNSSRLLFRKDRHVLAGSWGLPFGFLLAFTGAFFSFAGALGLPVVAMVAFGGDQIKMIETIVGVPTAEDPTPAELADLDAILTESTARAESVPLSIVVSHWGRADATITLFHPATEAGLTGDNHVYAGASGDYRGTRPFIGTQPSAGNTVIGLMGPLHFGNFGGLLGKIVWLSLGFALCYVTLTGLQLWAERRREERVWKRLARSIPIVGYGTAIALAGAGVGFFLSFASGDPRVWVPLAFLITSIACVIAGLLTADVKRLSTFYRYALGVGLVALPVLRILTGGPGWANLFDAGTVTVIGVDLVLLVAGIATLLSIRGLRASAPRRQPSVEATAS